MYGTPTNSDIMSSTKEYSQDCVCAIVKYFPYPVDAPREIAREDLGAHFWRSIGVVRKEISSNFQPAIILLLCNWAHS